MYDWKELFNHMPARYTRENSPEDIAHHMELHQKLAGHTALVRIKPSDDDRSRMITICCKDQPGLFNKIAGAFFLHDLDIQEARIYTWTNQTAVDIFKVRLPVDALMDDSWEARLESDLTRTLENKLPLDAMLRNKLATPPEPGIMKYNATPTVRADNDTSRFFTVISVSAGDSMGLLYRMTRALHKCKVNVCTARIATFGYLVMDVFFVQEEDGQKIFDTRRLEGITEALSDVLQNTPG